MTLLESAEIDKVAQLCINTYNKLPKTGKPTEQEWTVLSSIVKYNIKTKDAEVVSLGTGSKCIGASKMSPKGDILNDSHAEIIARRGFLVYLYDNIMNNLNKEASVFDIVNGKFLLKQEISFLFYSSQLPCGDASIIPKSDDEMIGDVLAGLKRKKNSGDDLNLKVPKLCATNDIYRTGAKCLPECDQEAKGVGKDYHVLGRVRTKPGRGDRTLSVSCSDKMCRWIHIGIHGAFIDLLLNEPIYLTHFIFGASMPYSEESIKRAFLYRCTEPTITEMMRSESNVCVPQFHQCNIKFVHVKGDNRVRPAPGSILWINTRSPISEVAVLGRKLGATKKKDSLESALCISKFKLLKRFLAIINKELNMKQRIFKDEDLTEIPYNKLKLMAVRYYSRWKRVKSDLFHTWTTKPDMWNFCVKEL